ncbi:MAG TPA: sugar transferase [Terriglobales bacterium]|nr:sugar transferase [Terriglobales bacterium]
MSSDHPAERSQDHLALSIAKRAFDVAAAAAALLLTLPITLAVALAILLESGGPVLYRGWRVGRYGQIFRICKFRSMFTGADRAGGVITAAGDTRVTRVGRVLRRTKLDELPQFLNVLGGDMSLVGPRPEHPNYVRLYTPEQRRVLCVRPGITGAASVTYRNEEELLGGEDPEALYRTVIMPDKLRLELEYLDRRSFWTDLKIIAATLGALPARSRPAAIAVTSHGKSPNGSVHPARRSR